MTAVIIGLAAAIVISLMDYRIIAKFWWAAAALALILTISVFFIGIQVSGTDDVGWIRLPFGVTFQPSELTKICFILTFSKHISVLDEKNMLRSFTGVITLAAHAAIPAALIHFQGDDGAALVFFFMFLIMSFSAGVQLRYFIILLGAVLLAVPVLWSFILNDDQKNRLSVLFSNDDSALQTYGWQQYQGTLSIASGGIYGKGFFSGPRVEKELVPYQENDFIFTVAGEELGFIGCAAIILLFALILLRIIIISSRMSDILGKSICAGFFALIGVQAMINSGMVLGILPVIGVTLPFFSSGGSAAVCIFLGVGLVQSSVQHVQKYTEN